MGTNSPTFSVRGWAVATVTAERIKAVAVNTNNMLVVLCLMVCLLPIPRFEELLKDKQIAQVIVHHQILHAVKVSASDSRAEVWLSGR